MHLRHFVFLLSIAGVISAGQSRIKSEDVKEVTVSFMPWKTMRTSALSPEDLRSNPNYRFSVLMPWDIEKLLGRLPIEQMKPTTETSDDTRLVIDIHMRNGNRVSFNATKFYFFTEDKKLQFKVTPEFRRLFEFEEMRLFK
jgi:hypothetical protein